MQDFISFVESLQCEQHLVHAIISAYRVIYEGRGDVDSLKYYSDVFNRIIQSIQQEQMPVVISDHDIRVLGDSFNVPNIIFGSKVESGFDAYSRTITINVPGLNGQSIPEMVELIKSTKSDCIHELIHFNDTQYKGNRRAFLKSHGIEGMARLRELSARVKYLTDLEKDDWMVDTAYFNNQTERNAYVIQYIWKCIERLLSVPDLDLSFNDFVKPLMHSDFYAYSLPSARKRIIKRLYYVWDAISRAMPDLIILDISDIESFLATLGKDGGSEISSLTESQGEIAVGEFGFDIECDSLVRGYATHRYNKTRMISNRNVLVETFIEGSRRINHVMSISRGSDIKIIKSTKD